MKKTQAKKQVRTYISDNTVEAKQDGGFGSSLVGSLKDDLVTPAITTDLWEQLLGAGGGSKSGDLREGESLDLKSLEQQTMRVENVIERAAPAIEYHREVIKSTEAGAIESREEIQHRIQAIVIELKKLANSSQELQVAFRQVSTEQLPASPGKYHLNFFEWVLSVIKSARLRVDESKSWLSLFASKKTKRSYWSMFKKHGTTFGLSSERVVATQTG